MVETDNDISILLLMGLDVNSTAIDEPPSVPSLNYKLTRM